MHALQGMREVPVSGLPDDVLLYCVASPWLGLPADLAGGRLPRMTL
jgi:hypothetical protein